MDSVVQQWIWMDALRTNWRAIQLRLMPASPALLQSFAAISGRLKAAGPADEFAVILDDLMDLLGETEAAEFVRGVLARNTLPETPALSMMREEVLPAFTPDPDAISFRVPAPGNESARVTEADIAETSKALGGSILEPDGVIAVRVFFATNRAATDSLMPGEQFSGEYSPRVAFGQVSVPIPATHRKGNLEKPGFFQNQNVQDHFTIGRDLETLDIGRLRSRLAEQPDAGTGRELLVFIHGFNVTFEDALLRAAQLKYDLNFAGEIILFTWPSRGSLFSYAADLDSAQTSGSPLAEFLAEIAEGPWRRVHLLAHSMGGRVLLGGVVDTATPKKGLGQIALVAADVRTDLFTQQFPKFAALGDGKTSYVASKDLALWASTRLVNLSGRIGFLEKEPFLIEGMDTVDASMIDRGLLAHSYFSDIRAVLDDLGYLFGNNLPVDRQPVFVKSGSASENTGSFCLSPCWFSVFCFFALL